MLLDNDALKSSLRSRLAARRINYNLFTFESGSATVLGRLRGQKLSIDLAYNIQKLSTGLIEVSGYGWKVIVKSEDSAIGRIVKDIRKNEMRFNKYVN